MVQWQCNDRLPDHHRLEVHAELNRRQRCSATVPTTHWRRLNLNAFVPFAWATPEHCRLSTAVRWKTHRGRSGALSAVSKSIHSSSVKLLSIPDLPKGTRYLNFRFHFCREGVLNVGGKKIRIERIHLEEDAGKLIHESG